MTCPLNLLLPHVLSALRGSAAVGTDQHFATANVKNASRRAMGGLAGNVRGHELCLWVTVISKGGTHSTVGNYIDTVGDEVFINGVITSDDVNYREKTHDLLDRSAR